MWLFEVNMKFYKCTITLLCYILVSNIRIYVTQSLHFGTEYFPYMDANYFWWPKNTNLISTLMWLFEVNMKFYKCTITLLCYILVSNIRIYVTQSLHFGTEYFYVLTLEAH